MKNYALFSQNGRFIGYTNFQPTNGLFKEMPDSFDPTMNVYVGDYETGGLKHISELHPRDYREANIDKKWVMLESALNQKAGIAIMDNFNYPLFKQLNIVMDVLMNNKDKITLSDDFLEMYDKIQDVRNNISLTVESYAEAPKVEMVTKEQERVFIERYTQQQLNIKDEPVDITVIKNSEDK